MSAPARLTSDHSKKQEKKEEKAEEQKDKRSKMRVPTYSTYISKVLKSVHPKLQLDGQFREALHSQMEDLFARLASEAASLRSVGGRDTMDERDVIGAVRLSFKGQLGKRAVAAIDNHIKLYQKNDSGSKASPTSASARAELDFPVGRSNTELKRITRVARISPLTGVAMAATLEYVCAELLEISGNVTADSNRVQITPHDLMIAVSADRELNSLFDGMLLPHGGVVPSIQGALLPAKKQKSSAKKSKGSAKKQKLSAKKSKGSAKKSMK